MGKTKTKMRQVSQVNGKKQGPCQDASGVLELNVVVDKGSGQKKLHNALQACGFVLLFLSFTYTEWRTSDLIKSACAAMGWPCLYNGLALNKGWCVAAPSVAAFTKALKTVTAKMCEKVTRTVVSTQTHQNIKHEPGLLKDIGDCLDALAISDDDDAPSDSEADSEVPSESSDTADAVINSSKPKARKHKPDPKSTHFCTITPDSEQSDDS